MDLDWISESIIFHFRLWIGYGVDEKVLDWIRIAEIPYLYTTGNHTRLSEGKITPVVLLPLEGKQTYYIFGIFKIYQICKIRSQLKCLRIITFKQQKFSQSDPVLIREFPKKLRSDPVSSEICDLCGISDLLLFLSYFASQTKRIKFDNNFFDVCCVNYNILVRCQVPTPSYSMGITLTIENFRA